MKLVKITAVAVLSATAICATAQTETGTLDRQVDVSRNYTPEIGKAVKLNIAPNMSDTVALRPEPEYSITPNAWASGFAVRAINPARIESSGYDALRPLYIKAGGGYPGQSLFDLYANSVKRGSGSCGFRINHYGHYTDIKNDLGIKARALSTVNSAVLSGRVGFGRMYLDGEIGYDYDIWSKYGQFTIEELPPLADYGGKSPMQSYSSPHARIVLGNDFDNPSGLGFKLGAEGYYLGDRYDNGESGIRAFMEFGRKSPVHAVKIKGEYDLRNGRKNLDGFRNGIFTGGAGYSTTTAGFGFSAGMYVGYDMRLSGNGRLWLLPDFSLKFDVTKGYFVPFVTLESRLVNNSLLVLSRLNPYINPHDLSVPRSTAEYRLRGGISGSASSVFSYRVWVGGDLLRNVPVFANRYEEGNTTSFDVLSERRITSLAIGGELEGRIAGSFTVTAGLKFAAYSSGEFENAYSLPDMEASFGIRYNCRDKFYLRAGADLTGRRRFLERAVSAAGDYTYFEREQPAVADVSLGADYFFRPRTGIFIEGRNLAGSKLYIFNHYPDAGVTVSAGVKLLF